MSRIIHPELRRAIVNWLFDNENVFCRSNACSKNFKQYIYDDNGNYIIGGKDIQDYISTMDTELFR